MSCQNFITQYEIIQFKNFSSKSVCASSTTSNTRSEIYKKWKDYSWLKLEIKGVKFVAVTNTCIWRKIRTSNFLISNWQNLLSSSAENTSCKLLCNINNKKNTHTALQSNLEFSLKIIMKMCVTIRADY